MTILFRATEELDGEYPSECAGIDFESFKVLRETRCYYFICPHYGIKEKRVCKRTMKYAQLTKADAIESLKKRLYTQMSWWEARTEWAKSTLKFMEENGL